MGERVTGVEQHCQTATLDSMPCRFTGLSAIRSSEVSEGMLQGCSVTTVSGSLP